MNTKVKVKLSPEQETLLITLYAKSQPDNPLFFDPSAQNILNQVDYDFDKLNVPYKTIVLICQRAKKFDNVTWRFLEDNPGGVVIQLGCGLDNRFDRVDDGRVDWYDLDMAPVIDLREQLFAGSERYHMISTSVTELGWMEKVAADGRHVLVIAEGLLMYIDEPDVRRLVLGLRDLFPGCQLLADVFSKLTARSAANHPSLKSTGATLGWGIDDPEDLKTWSPGIQLIEEWYFSDDPDLVKLNAFYRFAYHLAGAFMLVKRAHRIVHYQL
jgi:O-methyltransferase involved in polyketide biosynthesis